MDDRERLHDRRVIQGPADFLAPKWIGNDDVRVYPYHLVAVWRQRPQRQIQQTFLLPHPATASDLNQLLGVALAEAKRRVERELDRHERNLQVLAKGPVIVGPNTVPRGVEKARDRPETAGSFVAQWGGQGTNFARCRWRSVNLSALSSVSINASPRRRGIGRRECPALVTMARFFCCAGFQSCESVPG